MQKFWQQKHANKKRNTRQTERESKKRNLKLPTLNLKVFFPLLAFFVAKVLVMLAVNFDVCSIIFLMRLIMFLPIFVLIH